MNRMVIKVFGIPAVDLDDRMADQLKIHFQRRSNGGADVLTVLPSSTPGQAYVVFESEEVPEVLRCNHVLEVGSKFYPIHVQKAHQSEVDMPVEAKLNIHMFPKPQDVRLLIESNGFHATELGSAIVHLKGPFLSLKLLRKQLAQLQADNGQDVPPPSTSSSAFSNGYSSTYDSQMEPNRLETIPDFKASSKHGHVSNRVHADRWRPMVDVASPLLSVSPTSLNPPQPSASPVYGNPGSRRIPNYSDSSLYSRPASSSQREARLLVEKDVLDYVLKYKEDFFKDIEMNYCTEMSLKDHEDVTTVAFLGKHCEKAILKLQTFIEKIEPLLRTQDIYLKDFNPNQQSQICERIPHYRDSGVIIRHAGDTVKVVGSSRKSFEVKQMLLGYSDDTPTYSERGRKLERNSRQRSSSLPRHYKNNNHWKTDQGHRPEYHTNATKEYSSDYQEELQPRGAAHERHGSEGNPNEESKRHSNSDSGDKNRKTGANPKQPDEVLLPASCKEKKSTNRFFPVIKKSIVKDVTKLKNIPWKK